MKISKKKIALVLGVVAIGGYVGWKMLSPATAAPIDFKDVVAVSTGAIESRIDLVAKVALTGKETLTFRETGKITALNVVEGQKVKSGFVLASLDTSNLDRDIASQRINLDNSRIALKKLYEASGQLELLKAKNTLEQSKRNLQTAQLDLDSLGREKAQALTDAQSAITESTKNIDASNQKLASMQLDLEYVKRNEEETIAQTKAE